jgi:pyridoxine 5-phosphate synthase
VHAGHGLTYVNVQPVARLVAIEELNIGHSIVSNAVFWGMEEAVRKMRSLIDAVSHQPSAISQNLNNHRIS